jgi:hypothetical protein
VVSAQRETSWHPFLEWTAGRVSSYLNYEPYSMQLISAYSDRLRGDRWRPPEMGIIFALLDHFLFLYSAAQYSQSYVRKK